MNSLKPFTALTAALILVGCGDSATRTVPVENMDEAETSAAPTETVAETTAPAINTGMRPQQIINVPSLLAEGRRTEAIDLASDVIQPLSKAERNALIDTYFDRNSEQKNNEIAIVVAEAIAKADPTNAKAHYVSGLAYFQGISVEKDAEMMARYWSVEALDGNKVVQGRLADAYGDSTSPIYDPAKADAARALAR